MPQHSKYSTSAVPLVIFDLPLSPWAVRAYAVLRRYMSYHRKSWPSVAHMAEYFTGKNIARSLKRGIRELKEMGVIKFEITQNQDGGSSSTVYSFPPDDNLKKIYEKYHGQNCGGGVSILPPPGVANLPPPPYIRIEVKEKHEEKALPPQNRKKSKAGFSQNIHPDTPTAYQKIRAFYKKTTGQEFRVKPSQPKTISGLLHVFPMAKLLALWEIWFRAGEWSAWARQKGYDLDAFAHAAPDLGDHPDFSRITKKYTED